MQKRQCNIEAVEPDSGFRLMVCSAVQMRQCDIEAMELHAMREESLSQPNKLVKQVLGAKATQLREAAEMQLQGRPCSTLLLCLTHICTLSELCRRKHGLCLVSLCTTRRHRHVLCIMLPVDVDAQVSMTLELGFGV